MTVNFSIIADKIHKAFDSDYIDIYRDIDNVAGRDELYTNIACHVAIKTADNAEPNNVDVQPIVVALSIHMPTWVDIRNGDYVIVKKMGENGQALHYYSGIVGEPAVSMARQFVQMKMETLKVTEPITPAPPLNKSTISISYFDTNDEKIKNDTTQAVEVGKSAFISPANINNYELIKSLLDGLEMPLGTIYIDEVEDKDYEVSFVYDLITGLNYIKPLVFGNYTKDNGGLAFGYHLYSKIDIISVNNDKMIISDKFINHEEIGTIQLKLGSKFKTNLGDWIIATSDLEQVDNGFEFSFIPYTPTEEEEKAYETNWYGG